MGFTKILDIFHFFKKKLAFLDRTGRKTGQQKKTGQFCHKPGHFPEILGPKPLPPPSRTPLKKLTIFLNFAYFCQNLCSGQKLDTGPNLDKKLDISNFGQKPGLSRE